MAMAEKREQAEKLYVKKLLTCAAIAEELGIDQATVYRWKNDAAKKDSAMDWDAKRRAYNVSPDELKAFFAETLKEMILKIRENPDLLLDSKQMDALIKALKVLQAIDVRGKYISVVLDLVKIINIYLAEHEPEIKSKMESHWDRIYEALVAYATERKVF